MTVLSVPPPTQYWGYQREIMQGRASEKILVANGLIVWQAFAVRQVGLEVNAADLKGVRFDLVKNQGFQLTHPEVTQFLVQAYYEQRSLRRRSQARGISQG